MSEDQQGSIIIDTGSFSCKAGISRDEAPRLAIRTLAAFAPGSRVPVCFGRDCLDKPEEFVVTPLADPKAPDWEMLEVFWGELRRVDPQLDFNRKSVLTNFPVFGSRAAKEKTTQLFFENFGASLYYAASDALLTLYSSGRVSGLVLECGHSHTALAPLSDGAPIPFAQLTERFGGQDIAGFLDAKLKLKGRKAATEIKEKELKVSFDYEHEMAQTATLPDGERLAAETRLAAAEAPFRPETIGLAVPGVHELAFESLFQTDVEGRREFVNNVILSGGVTALPNFNDRLQRDLSQLLPSILKVKCYSMAERTHSVWSGGAVLASLSMFHLMWISRAEYDDIGSSVVLRKCI